MVVVRSLVSKRTIVKHVYDEMGARPVSAMLKALEWAAGIEPALWAWGALAGRRLAPAERGLALLHEGGAALDVVFGSKAGVDRRLAGGEIARLRRQPLDPFRRYVFPSWEAAL